MKTYFDSELVRIKHDSNNNIIIATWKTPSTSEEYRSGMTTVLQSIKDLGTGRVVFDCVAVGAISPADQEWTIENFHFPALQYGYSHAAIVLHGDIFTKMSVEAIVNEVDNLKSKYFSNTQDAIEWIIQ